MLNDGFRFFGMHRPIPKERGYYLFLQTLLGLFFGAEFDGKAKILWSQIQSGLFV